MVPWFHLGLKTTSCERIWNWKKNRQKMLKYIVILCSLVIAARTNCSNKGIYALLKRTAESCECI